MLSLPTRRDALLAGAAAALAAPFASRLRAAPSETVLHASFGAAGMAWSDIQSLAKSKFLKLVAVAEVDESRLSEVKKRFPEVRVYSDWRVLLDKEKIDSANVSTPDHMHGSIAQSCMKRGVHVYCQKPLTQTIHEARVLTKTAADNPKLITQMGIQIHSHPVHKLVVELVHAGAIGKVKAVHSWSGKDWGDTKARPDRTDPVPAGLNWDQWLGVAAERPFLEGYYHPGNWRKRLDFGTGTFGDMGCHILDPVFSAAGWGAPSSVKSVGPAPNADSWALNAQVTFTFPETKFTTPGATLTWHSGGSRPGADVAALLGGRKFHDQGSVYIGTEGVLYSPYIDDPILLPEEKFKEYARPKVTGDDHYLQFVEAVRGNGKTSAPFAYAGPLTEAVLLGCLATRFPEKSLEWDAVKGRVTNHDDANRHVRREPRKGWEVEGL